LLILVLKFECSAVYINRKDAFQRYLQIFLRTVQFGKISDIKVFPVAGCKF